MVTFDSCLRMIVAKENHSKMTTNIRTLETCAALIRCLQPFSRFTTIPGIVPDMVLIHSVFHNVVDASEDMEQPSSRPALGEGSLHQDSNTLKTTVVS